MKNNQNIQSIDHLYKAFAPGDMPTVLGEPAGNALYDKTMKAHIRN